MSESSNIELLCNQNIARIRLNHPEKHNSLSSEDIDSFIELLERIENDPDIRVLVVTGAGEKTFCSGASLTQLSDGNMQGDRFVNLTDRLASFRLPTICAMNGSAYGGGVEIGLCCDFRVGIKGTKLFVPPARFGICYPVNGIRRYVNRLGPNLAKRILVASEDFTSEEMLQLGYFTHLVEAGELESFVQNMAERISTLAPLSVTAMKQICNQITGGELNRANAEKLIQQCRESEDLKEGLAAIKEKRKPSFKGK